MIHRRSCLRLLSPLLVLCCLAAAQAREFPPDAFPADDPAEQQFRQAHALEEAGDPAALDAYRRLLVSGFPVPDAIHAALGRLLTGPAAEKHWQQVLAASPASPFREEALAGLAGLRADEGRLEEARALWEELARSTPDEDQAASSWLRVLEILDRLGRKREARAVAERLWVDYAHLPESREAGQYLARESGDPLRPVSGERILQRGQVLLRKGRRDEAVETLSELRRRLIPGSRIGPDVDLALGKALYFLRRYEEAVPILDAARASPRTEEEARFYRARSLFGLDRGDEGARDLAALAKKFSSHPRAPLYLYQACRVFEGRRMWHEAAQAREALLERYPGSSEALEAKWNDGWRAFQTKEYRRAAQVFASVAQAAGRGWRKVRALYWQGRALRAAGRETEGRRALHEVLDEFPLGYYARLARSILSSGRVSLELGDPRGASLRPLPVFPPQRGELAFDPEATRPIRYLRLGLEEGARRILQRMDRRGVGWARLCYWCEDFHGAIRAAACSWLDWPPDGVPAPLAAQGLAYPLAYPRSATLAAREAGIHPHLLLAVSHTESHFDPDAYSIFEARGLMQFIPSTGATAARQLGLEGFQPEDLYEPKTALRLGAEHLRELLDRFHGDVVAAVAAYNAGATAVERWRERWGGQEPDVFVECIPYRETRRYVKKVITALDAYGRLDPPGLWPGEAP